MKSAKDMRQSFDYASSLQEWALPSVKYDNRSYSARSLHVWESVQNRGGKLTPADALPHNDAPALLAGGYAAAFGG